MVERHENSPKPNIEEATIIKIGTEEDHKEVKIGMSLANEQAEALSVLLKEFQDVFAWSYKDMPGLDTDIVKHNLPLKAEFKPVKEKLRRIKPVWLLKIREEVMKEFEAGFLRVASYPEWVANIVPLVFLPLCISSRRGPL